MPQNPHADGERSASTMLSSVRAHVCGSFTSALQKEALKIGRIGMWIVVIAWLYVALTMSLAEATNPQGTVLGALITFLCYGVGPLALVMYLLGAPARRKARLAREAAERAQHVAALQAQDADHGNLDIGQGQQDAGQDKAGSTQTDAGGLATGDAIAPERKEP